MRERDSGKGRLVSMAVGSRMFIVDYVLETDSETDPNTPRYTLEIEDEEVPDGEYNLRTSDTNLRVRKFRDQWQVVA
jgi:hypothetical protein